VTATAKIVINPVTRISGFMEIEADIENKTVVDAKTGGLLFRGFEKMLTGRSPLDAVYFSERICGICSAAHATASAMALEEALGVKAAEQSRYLRDIIHAFEYLQNHIRHFYQYTVPDYVKFPESVSLFAANHGDFRLPKHKNDPIVRHYLDSLDISRSAHEAQAILGGKAPHNHGVFVGGISTQATPGKISAIHSLLRKIMLFINEKMIPDAYTIARYYSEYYNLGLSYGNFLSYGCFSDYEKLGTLYLGAQEYSGGRSSSLNPGEITESICSSWYTDRKDTYSPFETVPEPDIKKAGAYSWVKAPRYKGLAFETGPLARMWLSGGYRRGSSAMDRTLARVLETKKISEIIMILLKNVIPGYTSQREYHIPENASGSGLIDTTRGALGHWLKIDNGLISFYQIITPSVWNLSGRSADGAPGPGEKALIGTPVRDAGSPVELGRIIRSFDPCVSCATHIYTGGRLIKTVEVVR
jgi:hydrogenase large subunit